MNIPFEYQVIASGVALASAIWVIINSIARRLENSEGLEDEVRRLLQIEEESHQRQIERLTETKKKLQDVLNRHTWEDPKGE